MLWRLALIAEWGFDCVQKIKQCSTIGICCLANIGSVLFTIFRPVDSVNEALEKYKDGDGWFMVGC